MTYNPKTFSSNAFLSDRPADPELIVLTHNDLDAAGAILNIEFKTPDITKQYFCTNYNDLSEIAEALCAFAAQRGLKKLVATDVSFSDNLPVLEKLAGEFEQMVVIDHHMYPVGFWETFEEKFPRVTVVYDTTKCATELTADVLGNANGSPEGQKLDKLSKLIGVYDIWKYKHPAFDLAQSLNDYFWEVGMLAFVQSFTESKYGFPTDYSEVTDRCLQRHVSAVSQLEAASLIRRVQEVTVAFMERFAARFVVDEHRRGQEFVIVANSYGIIRIRINQDSDLSSEQLNDLRFKLTGHHEYGHPHAFTYKVDVTDSTSAFEEVTKEIQRIIVAINSVKERPE